MHKFLLGLFLTVGAATYYMKDQHEKSVERVTAKYRLSKRSKDTLAKIQERLRLLFVGVTTAAAVDNQASPETLILIDWDDLEGHFKSKAESYVSMGQWSLLGTFEIVQGEFLYWSRKDKTSDDFKIWSRMYTAMKKQIPENYRELYETLEE